jgi:hypothetical protein
MIIRVSSRSFRGEILPQLSLLTFSLFAILHIAILPHVYGQNRRFTTGNRLQLPPNSTVRVENKDGDIQIAFSQRSDLGTYRP